MPQKSRLKDVDIEYILISSKCFKFFIGYANYFNRAIKPLHIKLPRSNETRKRFKKCRTYLLWSKKNKKVL